MIIDEFAVLAVECRVRIPTSASFLKFFLRLQMYNQLINDSWTVEDNYFAVPRVVMPFAFRIKLVTD